MCACSIGALEKGAPSIIATNKVQSSYVCLPTFIHDRRDTILCIIFTEIKSTCVSVARLVWRSFHAFEADWGEIQIDLIPSYHRSSWSATRIDRSTWTRNDPRLRLSERRSFKTLGPKGFANALGSNRCSSVATGQIVATSRRSNAFINS